MLVWQIQADSIMIVLLGIVLIHARYRIRLEKKINWLAMNIIRTNIMILILEIGSICLSGPSKSAFRIINIGMNSLGFAAVPLIAILGIKYVFEWLEMTCECEIKLNKWFYIPAVINIFLAVVNLKFYCLGNVDAQNVYQRGDLFWVVPSVFAFYFLICLGAGLKYHKKMPRIHLYMCEGSALILGLAVGLQLKFETFLIIWPTVGMLIVIHYIFLLFYQLQHDTLTGLENREGYLAYTRNLENKKSIVLAAISMDLDGFKMINDVYGHLEGDIALKRFAKLMEESFRRYAKLIRMGGDEFLIFIEDNNEEHINKQIENFKSRVDTYNLSSGKPYALQFSYGMAVYNENYLNIGDFLDQIDQRMYLQKSKKKRERLFPEFVDELEN